MALTKVQSEMAGAGQVLQVVSATTSTEVQTTSSTFVDTGLTATITPKFATSKILVVFSQNGCAKSNNTGLGIVLFRNGTGIFVAGYAEAYSSATTNYIGSISGAYLDSPATTSSVIYKTQQNSVLNTSLTYTQVNSVTSTITLLEIAA